MAVISGRDPRAGDAPFVNPLFLMHTGGAGAPAADAWLTTVHIGDLGLCYLDSVEIDELRYPIRVERRGLLPDTEGAGRYRGAPAGLVEFGPVDTAMEAWFASDGTLNPPLGVRGGLPGGGAAQFLRRRDGGLEPVPACGGVRLAPGETLVSICCGGGGYGPPQERDPRRVAHDVAEGLDHRGRAPRRSTAWPVAVHGMSGQESMHMDEQSEDQRARRVTACAWRCSPTGWTPSRARWRTRCYRTARSGVLNSGHDFSCAILTADCRLLTAAESLPIHVMIGPDLMCRVDPGVPSRSCSAATPSCTTRPTTATRIPPTSASSCR